MRQVVAIVAAGLLAILGAVVLGEYPLEGTTALIGFPLYGLAVAELALAVAKRLAPLTVVVVAAVVAGGLVWALWISFGHFRNGVTPPGLSWVMVGVAVVAALAWGRPGRRRHRRSVDPPAAQPATQAGSGTAPGGQRDSDGALRVSGDLDVGATGKEALP